MGNGEWGVGERGSERRWEGETRKLSLLFSRSPAPLLSHSHSPFPFPLHRLYLVIPKFAWHISGNQISSANSRLGYEEQ
jgi:hypothetical protein